MKVILSRVASATIGFLLLAATVQSQQSDQNRPLGDVARDQKQARKQQKKTAEKMYTEIDASTDTAEPEKEEVDSQPSSVKDTLSKASAETAKSERGQAEGGQLKTVHRPVFDRAKTDKPDFIIVPVGTEIRVDIVDGKVVVPVRVGFATPIPALSRASVKVNRGYSIPSAYNAYDNTANYPVPYIETADLTSITVGAVAYPVHATTVPLNSGATQENKASIPSIRDATFVLTAPLPIER